MDKALLVLTSLMFGLLAGLSGCVSFGVECRRGDTHAWAKVRRVGWGVSMKQADTLAQVKSKVCE